MTRFILLIATLLTLALGTPVLAQTVILVRHAEKADQSADPVLSDEGETRAQALSDRLSSSPVDLILISPLQRTRLTAAPTAQANNLEPQVVDFEHGIDAHIADIVARVKSMPEDATILIVGHSNTVPLIARDLGQRAPDMPECEYDRFLSLRLQGEGVFAITMRYGAPSNCPA